MPVPRLVSNPETAADPVIRTLLFTDLVASTRMVEKLGDTQASEIAGRHDRTARDLLPRFRGLEIDKTDGFLLLFERPIDAVGYALAYHQALAELSRELGVELAARAGIHLGEVLLRENSPADMARGAKRLEVEGIAKPTAARVMSLALGNQTLLTHGAFDLARRSAVGAALAQRRVLWLAHGSYRFKGVEEPMEIFEAGALGTAPLSVPPDSEKARRIVPEGEEITLGWRPAPGQDIPLRPNWALAERLGTGGFGEVWLAGHKKTGDKRVFKFCYEARRLRSLRREATLFRVLKETLGQRDDIARILDWNFDQAPYFLELEYTEGRSLVEWAEAQGGLAEVPLATRLELVAQAAEALGAAHSVGVLHKDVKPSNVLVTSGRDGAPKARLTDFGIGRVVDESVLAEQGITVVGLTEVLPGRERTTSAGTQLYLAPELLEGKASTVQADVYALGVMLYQMVVGDLSRALAPGWRRDVPDKILARDIAQMVDGSPERRPSSASAAAGRLRRLEERRAAAQAAEAMERSHRRWRLFASFGALAGVVLLAVSILAVQATQARRIAELRRGQAEDLISFMVDDLATKLQLLGRLDLMNDVGSQAMKYFASVPNDELSLEELNQRSNALDKIGLLHLGQSDHEAALAAYQEALNLARGLAQRDPDNAEWQQRLSAAHFAVGRIYWLKGSPDQALANFEAQLEISRALAEKRPDDRAAQLELANARTNVGFVYRARGDLERAAESFGSALALMEKIVDRAPADDDLLYEYSNKTALAGSLAWQLGQVAAARRYFEDSHRVARTLAERDPSNAFWQERLGVTHNILGRTLEAAGDAEAAHQHFEQDLEIFEKLVAIEPRRSRWQRELAMAHRLLSRSLSARGDSEQALEHARRGAAILTGQVEKDPQPSLRRDLAALQVTVADRLIELGDRSAARESARAALALLEAEAEKGPEDRDAHRWLGTGLLTLGRALEDPAEARAAWARAAAILEPFARDSSDLDLLGPWRRALELTSRRREAAAVEQRAEELRRQLSEADTSRTARP